MQAELQERIRIGVSFAENGLGKIGNAKVQRLARGVTIHRSPVTVIRTLTLYVLIVSSRWMEISFLDVAIDCQNLHE